MSLQHDLPLAMHLRIENSHKAWTFRMTGLNENVLIVDDDFEFADVVKSQLEELGLKATVVGDGKTGLAEAISGNYCLVVLDLGLPSMGGISVCRELRTAKPSQPILILTGDRDDTNLVLGLEIGADEFIRKPFNNNEFRARVRALLRRSATSVSSSSLSTVEQQSIVEAGELTIDLDRRHVFVNHNRVHLTPTEFDFLAFLLKNSGKTFTREQLMEQIWGAGEASYDQNVRAHISRLRAKIAEAGAKIDYIVTDRGFGYRFELPKQ